MATDVVLGVFVGIVALIGVLGLMILAIRFEDVRKFFLRTAQRLADKKFSTYKTNETKKSNKPARKRK